MKPAPMPTESEIRLTIPWDCLASDNLRKRYTRGKGDKGWGRYKQAREAMTLVGMDQYRGELLTEKVWVRMDFHLPNFRRRDCSNFLKAIFDSLTGVVWKDDSQINDVGYLVHPPDGNPRVEIRIGPGIYRED